MKVKLKDIPGLLPKETFCICYMGKCRCGARHYNQCLTHCGEREVGLTLDDAIKLVYLMLNMNIDFYDDFLIEAKQDHFGDCTGESQPCSVCIYELLKEKSKTLIKNLPQLLRAVKSDT